MKIIPFVLCLIAYATQATEVYISRDAQGNVVFSDRPSANSQRHEVRELPSVPAFVAPVSSQTPAAVNEPTFSYTSLSIITPTDGQTIPTGMAGNVEVSGVLSPGLREADSLLLLSNGNVLREGRQTSFQLTNLDRGEHTLQMVVRDKDGKNLISSNPVTLFVQRASILNRTQPAPKKTN